MFFKGLIITQTVKISPTWEHSFLLGVDFSSQNSAIFDYKHGMLSLHDDLVRMPLQTRTDTENCTSVARTTCLPAFTKAVIPMHSPSKFNNKTVLLETLPQVQFDEVAKAKAFVQCNNNTTVCRILNYNPHTVTLKEARN